MIALAIAGGCAYTLVIADQGRHSATKQLNDAAVQLNKVRQDLLKTQQAPQVSIPSDALNAAELLQSDWAVRMTEVERCVVEPARLVRLQLQGGMQSSSAYLDGSPGTELQKVLECLNAGVPTGDWSVAELKSSNLAPDRAASIDPAGNVRLLWRRR